MHRSPCRFGVNFIGRTLESPSLKCSHRDSSNFGLLETQGDLSYLLRRTYERCFYDRLSPLPQSRNLKK